MPTSPRSSPPARRNNATPPRSSASPTSCSSATSMANSQSDLPDRDAVCRVIRQARPDVVLGHDPWQPYRIHPDHLHAGWLVTSGIVAARDPHFFPEQGVAPHRPSTLLCFEPGRVDARRERRRLRRRQGLRRCSRTGVSGGRPWRSTTGPTTSAAAFAARLHDEARADGFPRRAARGEAFARIDDL